ncbi:TPA_asm: UL17 uORF [Human alphaherpesvirus 1]|nr:TPA_asm: UL17 uORF [Human alphaherpesvirus 1]
MAFPVLVDDTKIILQLAWLRKPIIVWTASGRIKLASSTKSRLKSWPRIP